MSAVDYGLLERQIEKKITLAIQEALKEINTIHRFSFTIEAEGRLDGDIKIGYRVGTDYGVQRLRGHGIGGAGRGHASEGLDSIPHSPKDDLACDGGGGR